MGLFGPKRIACPAGVWTTIVATSFAQIPRSWTVRFTDAHLMPEIVEFLVRVTP